MNYTEIYLVASREIKMHNNKDTLLHFTCHSFIYKITISRMEKSQMEENPTHRPFDAVVINEDEKNHIRGHSLRSVGIFTSWYEGAQHNRGFCEYNFNESFNNKLRMRELKNKL
ncbi:hypothetical protein Bhyg_14295 [Pseudolycoriella hygida]|uniref:Uncharacterized protein n=1 Tax=Pseudolycoriella hygida TaxID=35572 RepID=A0A9Q0MQB5_9DIPT|nr:hypothetical protein Bhyg_14295 [Pseudolycoriella hygida]